MYVSTDGVRVKMDDLIKENMALKQQVEDLKKEIENLKKDREMSSRTTDLQCYCCSTVDNAKYECEECGVLMCLDHSAGCGWCGRGPYCAQCVNKDKYCEPCRKTPGVNCCYFCGETEELLQGCSVCKMAETGHQTCHNSMLVTMCICCEAND